MKKNFVFSNEKYNPYLYLTSGGYEATVPSHRYGPLGRSGYMLHYISDGKGVFISNDVKYHLKKGDFIYIEPNKTVTMIADKNDPWSFYWIRFTGELLKQYMSQIDISYKNPVFSIKDTPVVPQKIVEIVNYSQEKNSSDFLYSAKLLKILNSLCNAFPSDSNSHSSDPDKLYTQALYYIRNNYESAITINDVVEYLNVDRTYLFKLFKENMNIGPKEYLTKYRLKKATELLKVSSESITFIAQSCGFSTYQRFTRIFHKYIGCTPSEYKDNH
ncbi:AraC family transcriptional regulator [Companilactobacillus huachuanensis]|uniref:AraC family transcriptional regulator n=1 Tax=Companilactobacillus huachuanensis TaxID=2559914 RepID=A0ABW1RIK1_9LACO|nr:AraC family transcriptional regulator [Companilactobacillus huachuanensis]